MKFTELVKIYKKNLHFSEIQNDGEIIDNGENGIVSTDQIVIVRATLDNLLIVIKEIINSDNSLRLKKRIKDLNNIDDDLHITLLEILELKKLEGEVYESHEALVTKAEIILDLINSN